MANELVLKIRLDGAQAAAGEAKSVQASIDSLSGAASSAGVASRGAASSFADLGKSLAGVGLGVAGSLAALVAMHHAMTDTQVATQKLDAALRYVSGSVSGAAGELEYLRRTSQRLGLDFASASVGYSRFAAATKESGISGETTRATFEGISKAASHLGLSAEETSGALLALSQMASKGTVSAEELRGQLGERLPGAFAIAAKAMGVTQAELSKMIETGQLATSDFLPKFAAALNDSFGQPVDNVVASLNRLSSAWDLWKRELSAGSGNGGMNWLTDSLNESSAAMRRLGNEAGLTTRILVGYWGALAGGLGVGAFDTAGRQKKIMQETLPDLKKQIDELEKKKGDSVFGSLNYLDAGKLGELKSRYRAVRQELDGLAVSAGKLAGFKDPDLKGQYEAQQAKATERLGGYLKDTANETRAVKIAAAVEAENKAFAAATVGLTTTSKQYAEALEAHQRRVEEIKSKGEKKGGAGGAGRAVKELDLERQHEEMLRGVRRQADEELRGLKAQDLAMQSMDQTTQKLRDSYARQNSVYGEKQMTAPERELAAALRQVEEAADRARDALANKASTLPVDNVVALEAYRAAMISVSEAEADQIDQVRAHQAEQERLNSLWETGAERALTKYLDNSKSIAEQTEQAFTRAFQGMEDALMSFITTGKGSFADLAKSIIADLARIELRTLMGNQMGGAGGGFGGIIAGALKMFGGMGGGYAGNLAAIANGYGTLDHAAAAGMFFDAKGGVYGSAGRIERFAKGGAFTNQVIRQPTLFRFARGGSFGTGMMGEAGDEAVMPLARDSSGRLGVRGGGSPVSITVNLSGPGSNLPEVRRAAGQGAREAMAALQGARRYG